MNLRLRLRIASVRSGSFTSFPPSRRVRFAPRADIRPMPAFMSTRSSTTLADFSAGTGFPNHFFCDSWVVGFLEGPTMVSRTSDWRDELGRWLKPFVDRLGHKARRQMCPLYVSGLIG